MERDLQARVNLPVVRVNRGGLYAIVAALGIVIVSSLSMTAYSLHNYAMLKRHAQAVTPGLKPATPVKNKRTFVVQSINGTLFMIARQKERTTNQNPSARRSAGRQSPPAAGVVASKAPPEAYDILEASVSWNETHSK
ncbi:hypothetical protein MRX96_016971 [Rhipicephalus microplus]